MEAFKSGDRVKVTIEGTVGRQSGPNGTSSIETPSGIVHFVFLDAGHLTGTKIEKVEPECVPGQAYIDADGDVLIRTYEDKWMTSYGAEKSDSWASRPLRKLVPEAE